MPAISNGKFASDKLFLTPDLQARLIARRGQVQAALGQVVLTMMMMPRYQHMTIGDLRQMLLVPLLRDRLAVARMAESADPGDESVGAILWASVSDEVDAKIRAQVSEGTFPVSLAPAEWTSGQTKWVLDVIASDRAKTLRIFAGLKQLIPSGPVKIHPAVTRLIGSEHMKAMRDHTDRSR